MTGILKISRESIWKNRNRYRISKMVRKPNKLSYDENILPCFLSSQKPNFSNSKQCSYSFHPKNAPQVKKILAFHTQKNLFEILINQPEIRLYLPFSDWFGIKRMSVWFQINRIMVNTIWFRVDLIRFQKDFSVCNTAGRKVFSFCHIFTFLLLHVLNIANLDEQ